VCRWLLLNFWYRLMVPPPVMALAELLQSPIESAIEK
jgi:hypothetical protein